LDTVCKGIINDLEFMFMSGTDQNSTLLKFFEMMNDKLKNMNNDLKKKYDLYNKIIDLEPLGKGAYGEVRSYQSL